MKRRLHVLCIVVLLGRAFCDLGALENFLA